MWLSIVEIIGMVIVVAAIGVWGISKWLELEAAREVKKIPKIPMISCDKHGLLPADSAIRYTAAAAGQPDLVVESCPICWGERYNRTADIIEAMEKRSVK